MRIISASRPIVIGGILALSSHAQAADIAALSRISAVTVYPDGATVTRQIEAEIVPGSSTIVVKDLPSSIDPLSLRIEGSADEPLAIASVDTKIMPGQASAPNDVTARLEALTAQRRAVQGRIEAAEVQKSAVQRYAQAGPDALAEEGKPFEPADWSKAWAAIGDGMEKVNDRLFPLLTEAQRLDAEIQAIGRAQAPLSSRAPRYEARIAVDVGTASKVKLTLTYQVRGARWTPLYDARLATTGDKPKLQFSRRASIAQRTGEDWQGVVLRVSTTRLNRGTNAPAVNSSLVTLRDLNQPDIELWRRASCAARKAPAAVPAPPMDAAQRGSARAAPGKSCNAD